MGNGIAHTFAQFDYKVQLIDVSQVSLDKGMATITKNLDRMVAKESITEADKQRTLKISLPIQILRKVWNMPAWS